ncbi:acyl-CoA N-acyltransferase [Hortaea werneckii]|nr:acyl-CoA N-acyltransferase [Hortaea werneckii]
MSLVNLAHVCSHLQNASLARLGLTSIPYTRLHLSLALLLHKQGFLSQVHLGGASPPAACFPGSAAPDNHHVTSAPHRDRRPRSGEAALWDVVYGGVRNEEALRLRGYPEESIQFAVEGSRLSGAQLEADGWRKHWMDFVLEHGGKSEEDLVAAGVGGTFEQKILRQSGINSMLQQLPEGISSADAEKELRRHLRKRDIDRDILAYFAGPAAFATPRHLERDGITIQAMGLEIPSQHVTPLPPTYRDPWNLEGTSPGLEPDNTTLITNKNRASRRLWLGLKYWEGSPVLTKARLISKPTKRLWLSSRELGAVVRGSHAGEVKGLSRVGEIMAMANVRPMTPMDLLRFNPCNLDHLTETYNIGFYLDYFTRWPQLCKVMENESGQIEAYILGKLESSPYPAPIEPYDPNLKIYQKKFPNYLPWHAHITCLTVAPASRRKGFATKLSEALEVVGDEQDCWFVDLFVRVENEAAIQLYKRMGYSVYRRIIDYYNGGSDAYDMRKPLKRDKNRKTVRANGENIRVDPSEVW